MTAPYTAAEILSLTNAARQTAGVAPLHPDPLLTQAAQNKASAMLAAGSWSHNTPQTTPWEFLDQVGYRYQIAGENLARNFSQAQQVIDGWLKSPSHRDNLLNPAYTQTGVAVATGSADSQTSLLVVQYLGTPLTDTIANQGQFYTADMISSITPNRMSWLWLSLPLLLSIFFILNNRISPKKPKKNQPPQAKHWRS